MRINNFLSAVWAQGFVRPLAMVKSEEKTAEQHTRELFSWFADDHSIWSKEDCAALAKAALSIRQLTEAESITYYKAIRDGK